MTFRHQRRGLTDYDEMPRLGWGALLWVALAAIGGLVLWGGIVWTLVSLAGMQ